MSTETTEKLNYKKHAIIVFLIWGGVVLLELLLPKTNFESIHNELYVISFFFGMILFFIGFLLLTLRVQLLGVFKIRYLFIIPFSIFPLLKLANRLEALLIIYGQAFIIASFLYIFVFSPI